MGGKPPRLFLDANVLFSAAYDSDSRSAVLFELAKRRRGSLVTSSYAVEEARRNLELKRPEAIIQFRRLLRLVRVVREASVGLVRQVAIEQGVPAPDAPILAAALQARVEYLVTGDRSHFGHLMERRFPTLSTEVLSLAAALKIFLSN